MSFFVTVGLGLRACISGYMKLDKGVEDMVMDEKKEVIKQTGRYRIIGLRLNKAEFYGLESAWKKSTVRKLSEYVRRALFGKKITVYSRNQSLDELVAELVLLRREMNAIGVNFNQAVHRLNMLDHAPQMQVWAERFGRDRDRYFILFEAVCLKINAISEQWLQ